MSHCIIISPKHIFTQFCQSTLGTLGLLHHNVSLPVSTKHIFTQFCTNNTFGTPSLPRYTVLLYYENTFLFYFVQKLITIETPDPLRHTHVSLYHENIFLLHFVQKLSSEPQTYYVTLMYHCIT